MFGDFVGVAFEVDAFGGVGYFYALEVVVFFGVGGIGGVGGDVDDWGVGGVGDFVGA